MNARNVLRALLLCAVAVSAPLFAAEAPMKIGIVGGGLMVALVYYFVYRHSANDRDEK